MPRSQNFFVCLVFAVGFRSLSAGDHHTLRFLYEDSRIPIAAKTLAISPDNKEVALGLEDGVVRFIRLSDGEQTSEIQATPFDMKYCRDGSRILMMSESEAFTLNLANRSKTKVDTRDVPGIVGLLTINRQGKLLVDSTVDGSPAALCNELVRGDEIVALGQGKSGEMLDVVGMQSSQFSRQLRGPAGTHVRIAVLKKNGEATEPILLQRHRVAESGTSVRCIPIQKQLVSDTLLHFQRDQRHTFVSAFDGKCCASIHTEDVNLVGQYAISPDQTLFAILSYTKAGSERFGIEIYDLSLLQRKQFIPFNRPTFNSISFSADGTEIFAGSHNRIDVYDVATATFVRGLAGTDDRSRPTTNETKLEKPVLGSVGTAVAGAAMDAVGELTFSETRIEKIAVTESLVAVAVPGGSLELWDVKNGNIKSSIAAPTHGIRPYMTPKVDLMQFSPDGHWLVYYIEGVLNIVDVSEFSKPSTVTLEE